MEKLFTTLRRNWALFKRPEKHSRSMQFRLILYFVLYLVSIMLGIVIILFATGVFGFGREENSQFFQRELSYVSSDIYDDFGDISVRTVEMAKGLADIIESRLHERGFRPKDMEDQPQLLEPLLQDSLYTMIFALEKTKSSGILLILDATVNPSLPNASFSRAGIFIKNMEPNAVNASFPNFRYLRGPYSIARNAGMNMLPQWALEFDIHSSSYFNDVVSNTKSPTVPLSRKYRWVVDDTLSAGKENLLLCLAPLIASDGTVLGVCGFEVSSMLFKLAYSPDNTVYSRMYGMISPVLENGDLDVSKALFSGNYPAYPLNLSEGPLQTASDGIVNVYRQNGNASMYMGLDTRLSLYPFDSIYAKDRWALSILVPYQDVTTKIFSRNLRTLIPLGLFMILSILGTAIVSRRYIKPVVGVIDKIKTNSLQPDVRTRILEIDDLIEFLSTRDDVGENGDTAKAQEQLSETSNDFTLYQKFLRNIKTLSAAERSVFNLYMKGYTAREIADILCLSINTIKTHNKRIYMKLHVFSRKELMVFVQMMDEDDSLRLT
jgi:DNA-binding CsgD family transcriptional regulator